MNELIIMWLLCIGILALSIIVCPIAYAIYRFKGGKESFWKWLIYEV